MSDLRTLPMLQRTHPTKMAAGGHKISEIWSLTLELIRLLTGKTIPVFPPPSLIPDRDALQMILEVTGKITELLIVEMESPLELCLEVKMEKEAEPVTKETAVGGDLWSDIKIESSEVTPVRSLLGEYGDGSAAGETGKEKESSVLNDAGPRDVGISHLKPEKAAEVSGKLKEERELFLEINRDGSYSPDKMKPAANALNEEKKDDITSTGALTTPNPHPALPSAELSSCLSAPFASHPIFSPHHKVQTSKNPYSCFMPQKSQFDQLELFHTRQKLYSCSECGKSFSHKSQLLSHGKLHTGEMRYSCFVCGKGFSQKSELIKHERVHTGEKPYSCSECGRRFSDKSNLSRHNRVHKGERPFSCSKCNKRFSQKSALITHERVHTGEKPYSCYECGKCFSDRSTHSKHEKLHKV